MEFDDVRVEFDDIIAALLIAAAAANFGLHASKCVCVCVCVCVFCRNARMLERIRPAAGSRGIDVMGGGGNRALLAAWAGHPFTSIDVRESVTKACRSREESLRKAGCLIGDIDWVTADGADVAKHAQVQRNL